MVLYMTKYFQTRFDKKERPICLEEFEANVDITKLPCNDIIHHGCLMLLFNTNHDHCPFVEEKAYPKCMDEKWK